MVSTTYFGLHASRDRHANMNHLIGIIGSAGQEESGLLSYHRNREMVCHLGDPLGQLLILLPI
jgi:hypothetical protein